jgi:hypothetical protein
MNNNINLIGINGKINSGKDTVGKIIQYLTSKDYLQEIGDIESYLESNTDYNFGHWNWQIKKFAGKLKEIASILTGIPVEKFEDQDFKKTNLGEEWSSPILGEDWQDGKPINVPITIRKFLQVIGTEAMRDIVHTNVWVNALFSDYKYENEESTYLNPYPTIEYPYWLITDLRFPNEFEAIKNRGGICIRVNRDKYCECLKEKMRESDIDKGFFSCSCRKAYREHSSENSLDNHTFDYILYNNGTIEELIEEVRKMLLHFKIINE